MRGDDVQRPDDLLAATRPVLSDLGWITGGFRDPRGAVPPSLSRQWGEAAWTARDLWVNRPAYAAARASEAIATFIPTIDVDAVQRTYGRLRRARALRAHEAPNPTTAMLALSARVASWTATLVVIAVALVVVLLGVQLGIVDALVK